MKVERGLPFLSSETQCYALSLYVIRELLEFPLISVIANSSLTIKETYMLPAKQREQNGHN